MIVTKITTVRTTTTLINFNCNQNDLNTLTLLSDTV